MNAAVEMIPGSDEWHQARIGKVTASRIADMMAKTKSGWGAGRKNYMAELVAERLTGKPAEHFVSGAMQWGIDNEPDARIAYEFYTDNTVIEVDPTNHPVIPMSLASPDGAIDSDGLVEIKCPNTATHIDTMLSNNIPNKYVLQMQWQMACTNRQWCDFVSFDPRMPENMELYVQRIERDDNLIGEIEAAAETFLAELNVTVNELNERYSA